MQTLMTERLILRDLSPDDADDYFEYTGNKNVSDGAGWKPSSNRDDITPLLKKLIDLDVLWAVEHRQDKKVIGTVGLSEDETRSKKIKSKMLSYSLSEPYWGQGLATEAVKSVLRHAFEELNLDLVSACHYPFNLKSRHILEKCGFVYEGTIRRAIQIWNGQIYDHVCYSLLREEFYRFT